MGPFCNCNLVDKIDPDFAFSKVQSWGRTGFECKIVLQDVRGSNAAINGKA
jgi:hypothetical protein